MLTITDVRNRIPHRNEASFRYRELWQIDTQVVHYEAGGFIRADLTVEQEIAHLIEVALFHHRRDFGGGALGRTLEYTDAILPSGRAYRVNDPRLITWSHKAGNIRGRAVLLCLGVGQAPTPAMLASLREYLDMGVADTQMRVKKPSTWGHGETGKNGPGPDWGNSTDCPGHPDVKRFVVGYRTEGVMPGEVKNPDNNGWFEATGFTINPPGLSAIGDYWRANGGVAEFGFPTSNEEPSTIAPWNALPELAGYTIQPFEYDALGWKPGSPVVRVRIGAALVKSREAEHARCGCD